ncbi:MAG: PhzF family phenazine biosynthesis protein [Phycisphaerales bacterium JB059]
MERPIYQIDAFTSEVFRGNPAAVVPLDAWLPDETLQRIALENNLSETAFFVPGDSGIADYHLRWFTPAVEVDLCGHATLASAHTLFTELGFSGDRIRFSTRASGVLNVTRQDDLIRMDLPAYTLTHSKTSDQLEKALGRRPSEVIDAAPKLLCVFENKRDVLEISPDLDAMRELDALGVIVTAPGTKHDFVSRFFAPNAGVDEDPVCGSAHCALTPYWADRLGRTTLSAHQVSAREGELACELRGDRVTLSGKSVTYLRGTIAIPG